MLDTMRIASGTMNLALVIIVLTSYTVSGLIVNGTEDRVVLVAPVLAAPKDSRARGADTETAKDFPILMLLATGDNVTKEEEPKGEPQPIYVQKLEDQKLPQTRRRRFSKMLINLTY
ncbi:uncharacterized protein LOC113518051 [Galleria mellonella]|uniref:Uncharacterized protein LOC113518051 n=1 Tax=Galleria mellonella TaxID=7137 RepID=A0A6J1WZF0_GALME|nr:uncharacterized protein LOC113518051 [Galleria mellonella]